MARRSAFPARGRTRSRQVAWALGPEATQEVVSSTGKTLWTSGVQLVAEVETTIVRIRGLFSIYLTLGTSPQDGFAGAAGIGIVNSDAFGIGTTAIPNPQTDLEWPGWIWHSFFDVRSIAGQAANEDIGINSGSAVLRLPIDSKAMRKFHQFETLVGMVGVVESGVASAEFHADTRILAKLS